MLEPGLRIHFIGIGGIGVSAVARIAVGRGYTVSGSDVRQSQLTDAMEALGATVTIGHAPENIDGVDIVVVSTAIPEHNVELATARAKGVRVVHRSEILAALIAETRSVGVTGTHGKGTVSSMITRILDEDGQDPGFVIGGLLLNYGVNARAGDGRLMVAEVDESDGTHRNIPTNLLVCNYLEADHLNYYDDLDDIIRTMAEVIDQNDALERVFVNGDCDGNRTLIERVKRDVVTYGVETECDYRGVLTGDGQLPLRFEAFCQGTSLGQFELPLPGRYNVTNAMAAIAVADHLGASVEAMQRGLADFKGLENRFTIVRAGGLAIVKDYNSHPTAMRKVLASARDLTDGRIVSIFKPYRYTLTNYLKDEYATAFAGSDEVIITTMYAANEDPIPGIDTEFVVNMLRDEGLNVTFIPDQTKIVDHLRATAQAGDKVIFFGGDDFFRMADAWADERGVEA